MTHATIDTVAVDMDCGEGNVFRANGSTIADPGFMMVYLEGQDEAKTESDEKLLPPLKQGDVVKLLEIRPEQHFTEPPPRFTEASLVKTLEEYGIGRPSTYASIMYTLKQREYVEFEQKRFTPTDIGRVVNNFLTTHFTDYVDYDFTARLEDELDAVSRGEKDWIPLMKDFWESFQKQIKEKEETVSRSEAIQARELGTDPKTGSPVSVRIGRFGPYAQIGTKEDEDKPKFAGLRPGQKLDNITLEEALELFKLPRDLGQTDEGEEVIVSAGRFGPYIRYGNKFVSLKEDDPYTVSLEKALELIVAKKIEDANKQINIFEEEGISVLNGRYGPYVTDGNKNVKIPKDIEPADLTVEDCQKMIAEAPDRPRRGGKKKASKKKVTAKKASKKTGVRKKTKKKAAKKISEVS
jgi:DNA topoisomerase-1